MKRGYDKELYSQRNKNETILSVIKRMFGEHVTSRLVKMQNRELTFRVIAYNMHRLSVFMVWFLQSPCFKYLKYSPHHPHLLLNDLPICPPALTWSCD